MTRLLGRRLYFAAPSLEQIMPEFGQIAEDCQNYVTEQRRGVGRRITDGTVTRVLVGYYGEDPGSLER